MRLVGVGFDDVRGVDMLIGSMVPAVAPTVQCDPSDPPRPPRDRPATAPDQDSGARRQLRIYAISTVPLGSVRYTTRKIPTTVLR